MFSERKLPHQRCPARHSEFDVREVAYSLYDVASKKATSREVAGSFQDDVIGFFNRCNPASRIMALGSTQPLIEISTKNLSGGKGWPALKADILTNICEPIV
jgi:hypothetical protein